MHKLWEFKIFVGQTKYAIWLSFCTKVKIKCITVQYSVHVCMVLHLNWAKLMQTVYDFYIVLPGFPWFQQHSWQFLCRSCPTCLWVLARLSWLGHLCLCISVQFSFSQGPSQPASQSHTMHYQQCCKNSALASNIATWSSSGDYWKFLGTPKRYQNLILLVWLKFIFSPYEVPIFEDKTSLKP